MKNLKKGAEWGKGPKRAGGEEWGREGARTDDTTTNKNQGGTKPNQNQRKPHKNIHTHTDTQKHTHAQTHTQTQTHTRETVLKKLKNN